MHGDRPAALRLLAEARHVRGEDASAAAALRRALAREADDPLALNNLAVLTERRGEAAAARAGYARAAELGSEPGAVAALNLARLSGDREAAGRARGALAHRDRLRADRFSEATPLWALVPARDLLDAVLPDRTLAAAASAALRDILTTSPAAALVSVASAERIQVATELAVGVTLGADVVTLVTLLALVWLPLGVRTPALPPPPAAPATTGWRRVARTLGAAASVAVPGSFDLVKGRAARGVAVLLGFALAVFVVLCVDRGGPIWQLVADPFGMAALFPGVAVDVAFPGLRPLAAAATLVAVALFAGNALATWRRARAGRGGAA
jgi:hypothetical protein